MNQSTFLLPVSFRQKRKILMLLVLIMLVGLEVAVGFGFVITKPYLFVLPIVPLLIAYFSTYLEQSVLVWLVCAIAVKIGVSTGTATKLPISLLFTGFWLVLWLIKMALNREIKFVRSAINLPSGIFLGLVLLSLSWSRFLLDPQVVIGSSFINVQVATIIVTILSVAIPILCINLVRKNWIIKVSFWLIVAASAYYLPFYLTDNVLSRFVNAGGLFPLWFCCITLSVLLNTRSLGKKSRLIIFITLLGWMFRLFVVTLVRISGWLPVLVGILVIIFMYSKKLFFFAVICGGLLVALNYQLLYDSIVVAKEQEGTLAGSTSRESLWGQAFQVASQHPILGTGPAGYSNYYMTYFRDHALSTHNNYLDMLLQYGVLGLLAFLWLCFTLINQLRQVIRLQVPGSFEYAFAIGCFSSSIGMMLAMWLGDWVIPFAYNQTVAGFDYTGYNWIFIGLGLSLKFLPSKTNKLDKASLWT